MSKTAKKNYNSVYYLRQIPKVVRIIKDVCAGLLGIKDVGMAIRVVNKLVVYIYVDHEAAKKCNSDLILPKEAGIIYPSSAMNKKRFPRLWLEEYAAELRCKKEIAKYSPNLSVEWTTMIRMPDNSVAPI